MKNALGKIFLLTIITGIFSAACRPASAESLEKIIAAQEKGWAAGRWAFSIQFQKQTLGKMEMEIKETKDGYEAEMATTLEMNKMKYEITGRATMTDRFELLRSDREEIESTETGQTSVSITAEVKEKILIITVTQDGKEAERTEIEAPAPLYAGTPALFAITKLLSPRKMQRLTFNLFNAENRTVSVTNLDILSDRKLITVGGRKVEAFSAAADNGKNKILFEIGPDNELVRFSPAEMLIFEKIFDDTE